KTLSSDERVCASIKEHKDIVEAIKAKDKDRAEELAILHMKNTIKNIEAHKLL
ncbi:MAG: FCD domain-containing protein, partial [Lachnospiraceae bacterium]|nr:FCD domain-containing protein [Lachnospiraceae bacterium]